MAKHSYTNEEIADWRKKHGSFAYWNPDDTHFLVPKAYGLGRTFNWAHPLSWLVGLVILAIIVYALFFK